MIFLKVTQALRIRHFKKDKKTNITLIYRIPKIQENKILYTRISAKKYRIPWLKTPKIPYTQNPRPGLNYVSNERHGNTCNKGQALEKRVTGENCGKHEPSSVAKYVAVESAGKLKKR